MSIPPLVCSTPPPPDQCEDDKDPEDFDIHFNLSQEDDYDYGSFSTYDHFQSAISVNKSLNNPVVNSVDNHITDSSKTGQHTTDFETFQWTNAPIDTKLENEKEEQIEVKSSDDPINIESKANNVEELKTNEGKISDDENIQTDKKVNNEEELNIEDLNLTIEEESLNSMVKDELYDNNMDSDKSDSTDKEKSPHIPDTTDSIIASDPIETLPLDEITVTPPSLDDIEDPEHSLDNLKMDDDIGPDYNEIADELETIPSLEINSHVEVQVTETFKDILNEEKTNDTDDEFGDFNDFCSTSDNVASTVVDSCDNPWETQQSDSNFGAFEANFDNAGSTEPGLFQGFITEVEKSPPAGQLEQDNGGEDDDFGDFDDFKSSTEGSKDKEETKDPLSQVLDFQATESESTVLENINKILNSTFDEEIPEPETVFDGKLEALLCETWGHLLETDVRQPYIVNWNSSCGQKTLLKALCIDSRNILFGPKWSYNMPKYATNLSAAPLQPQKQTTPSGPSQSDTAEKPAAKVPGTWPDPFTSDGQEFTYAEALLLDLEHLMATLDQMAHNHSTLKISELLSHACSKDGNGAAPKRPTDLNVFDTALPTKSDKIYSSTLDVQPIRQINLPDTHIFTPTDSETPRSKTIHYDAPTVFMSQPSVVTENKSAEVTVEPSADSQILDDGDYSDFQDFKGSFKTDLEVKSVTDTTALSMASAEPPLATTQLPSTSSVGILQPIKIEPIMPTLNWPSPGEVKETFDDFAEFASSTSWSNDVQEPPTPLSTTTPTMDIEKSHQFGNIDVISDDGFKSNPVLPIAVSTEAAPSKINDSFEDDFDTFQSALPSNQPTQAPSISDFSDFVASDFSQNVPAKVPSNQEPELDFVFPKVDVKSDPISFTKSDTILGISDPFTNHNAAISMPKVKESVAKVPGPPSMSVLQPTVSPSQPQSSAQILQPLSLESFSQINWPNPGINLQDLSRFNPVETLNSLKSDLSVSGNSKGGSPVHSQKTVQNPPPEDDIWGDFVSSKPKPQPLPKKAATFADDDEWTDFVSSPTVKPQNGLNTISLNVHTNLSIQKSSKNKPNNQALEIPITHYITPKSSSHSSYNDRHFQNL